MSKVFEGLKDKLYDTAAAGRSAAGKGVEQVQEIAESTRIKYGRLGADLSGLLKERAKLDVSAFQGAGFGLSDKVGERYNKAKLEGYNRVFDLGAVARAKVMFGLLCATKVSLTSDPDMCECVRVRIGELVDTFWSDLTVFVEQLVEDKKNETLGVANVTVEELGQVGVPPTTCSLYWWRAKLLYNFLPYDRSIFGQIKNPIFWVLTILSLIPILGIRVIFFAIVLINIIAGNPPDEYQLTSYILGFKGAQFISNGVLQAIAAAVRYYLCVHPGGTHTCDINGPGANQDLMTGLIDFVGSCVLVWVAFLFLPFSRRSAGMRTVVDEADVAKATQLEDAEALKNCCGFKYDAAKGGRLPELLGWDVFSFVISSVFCLTLWYIDVSHARPQGKTFERVQVQEAMRDANTWQGHTAIFWARVFYAFLAFPWIVFLIPGLNSILTHTTATGYNKNGACVPSILHPMPKDKDK